MHPAIIAQLRCPECRGALSPSDLLAVTHPESRWTTPQVERGQLTCDACGRIYPIVHGVPVLLPDAVRDAVLSMVIR